MSTLLLAWTMPIFQKLELYRAIPEMAVLYTWGTRDICVPPPKPFLLVNGDHVVYRNCCIPTETLVVTWIFWQSWLLTHCGLRTSLRGLEEKKLQVGHGGKEDGRVAENEERENRILCKRQPRTTRLSCEVQVNQSSLRDGQRPYLTPEKAKAPRTPNLSKFTLSVIYLEGFVLFLFFRINCTSMHYCTVCNRYTRHKQKIIKFHHLVE